MMNRLQKIYQPLLQKAIKIKYVIVSATAVYF
jgi:cobalt-zinc-cadmium resistance protein CzcA